MSSVTTRITEIKQPYGGYIKPSSLEVIKLNDGHALNPAENIHGTTIGIVVDYMTRYMQTKNEKESFKISLAGADRAERIGKIEGAFMAAVDLLIQISGLDDNSITCACKLVSYDIWLRNPLSAMMDYEQAKEDGEDWTNRNVPDPETIENIRIMVNRSLRFFEEYGPVTEDGFGFCPPNATDETISKWKDVNKGNFGGYTTTVDSGDGDFLTKDTLWDFKVAKSKPTSKHTLQLLMYWIMGKHSGQECFKGITKLGIFNPRLNTVYLYDTANILEETIKIVEKEVICYET